MNTQSDRHHWFVLLDSQRRGPLTYDDLTRAAKEGIIAPDTPVWRSGWKNWHPARSVKGLVIERAASQAVERSAIEQPVERAAIDRSAVDRFDRSAHEQRPVNETPLAPDDAGWTDEQLRALEEEETYQYAPPQHREARRAQTTSAPPQDQDIVALRWDQRQERQEYQERQAYQERQPYQDRHEAYQEHQSYQAQQSYQAPQDYRRQDYRDDGRHGPDDADDIFAEEWRMLAEQRPVPDRGSRAVVKAAVPARVPRKAQPAILEIDGEEIDYRPVPRNAAEARPRRTGSRFKRAAIGLSAVLLLAGGGWVMLKTGGIPGRTTTTGTASRTAAALASDLPAVVANMPAVIALQRNDPAAFERFRKRFADSVANARDDDVKDPRTLARNALRKSVKHLLAISSGDILLDLTEASLGYLQGLQARNPESCVWVSDEMKGGRLTSNLARDLPVQFNREMQVLERIASTDPHFAINAISDEEAAPLFQRVLASVSQKNVRMDLSQRERLEPSEFAPYCALVIAFYQAVLELPKDEKINALRSLYAKGVDN
jgi:hypothetical protein